MYNSEGERTELAQGAHGEVLADTQVLLAVEISSVVCGLQNPSPNSE